MLFTVPLSSTHPKSDFSCGVPLLDNYLHHQAGQDIRRKLSVCFVLLDESSGAIKGYYTLSSCSIPVENVPDSFKRKFPRTYSLIPAVLLGRLAVDKFFQNTGTGKILLLDAIKRCSSLSEQLGIFALMVDPLDESAVSFYQKYGFVLLQDSGKMMLPIQTIHSLPL